MKCVRLVALTVVAMGLFMTGCKSDGWQGKDVYNKVLKMYEKSEIKTEMEYKEFSDSKDSADVEFWFGKLYTKDQQQFRMVIVKKQGDSREAKDKFEGDLKDAESYLKARGHEVFRKDNIVIRVPVTTNPKLEKAVYDLFMSYVK